MKPLQSRTRLYLQARAQQERARADLHAAILDAIRAGVPQHEIVAVTGYSRETVRQIARSA